MWEPGSVSRRKIVTNCGHCRTFWRGMLTFSGVFLTVLGPKWTVSDGGGFS
jgi:hypothetical protein